MGKEVNKKDHLKSLDEMRNKPDSRKKHGTQTTSEKTKTLVKKVNVRLIYAFIYYTGRELKKKQQHLDKNVENQACENHAYNCDSNKEVTKIKKF